MKKYIVFVISAIAVFCITCKQEKPCISDTIHEFEGAFSIYAKAPYPLKSSYMNGVFQVDCEIKSDEEGDAFIFMVLRHARLDSIKGFGNNVKVDGFRISGYFQFKDGVYPNIDAPTFEYPVFVKKVKVPKDASIHEKINIHLPDTFTRCWGDLAFVRNSKDIEESMKTKIDPEKFMSKYRHRLAEYEISYYDSRARFDLYYKLFPDSSLFSYLSTSMSDLCIDYCEDGGEKNIHRDCHDYLLKRYTYSWEEAQAWFGLSERTGSFFSFF